MPKSPIGPCVVVSWHNGPEYVPIHPEYETPSPFETVEDWGEDKWVRYHPSIERVPNVNPGTLSYKITYDRNEHRELNELDICWGTSTITMDRGSGRGSASWRGADSDDEDGLVNVRPVRQGERVRANVRPIDRNQSQLRKLLLSTDRCCAITDEKTPSALALQLQF
jgi:hypothetical protein